MIDEPAWRRSSSTHYRELAGWRVKLATNAGYQPSARVLSLARSYEIRADHPDPEERLHKWQRHPPQRATIPATRQSVSQPMRFREALSNKLTRLLKCLNHARADRLVTQPKLYHD
jgi:hypothetical protein